MSKTIVKMQFGSHVYGTNVPESDHDYKGIILPSAKDILLQNANQVSRHTTKQDPHGKNTKDDEDYEIFSLQKYLHLLTAGQTVSLDMLFVPDEFILEKDQLWDFIRENKKHYLHSGVLSFIGYCRTQANKYGIKGSRMNAVKAALDFFKSSDQELRLESLDYTNLFKEDYIAMVDIKGANGKVEPHIEVTNRKFGMRSRVKYVTETLQKIYDEYGHRAKLAANNQGIDWKALMHAVRVADEAKELLTTGNIIFPRHNKDLLLQIRKGELPYQEVAKLIEAGLEELESLKSNLPEKPNHQFINDLLYNTYLEVILNEVRFK